MSLLGPRQLSVHPLPNIGRNPARAVENLLGAGHVRNRIIGYLQCELVTLKCASDHILVRGHQIVTRDQAKEA